jgi:type IV secretory pathway VirB9-like protein
VLIYGDESRNQVGNLPTHLFLKPMEPGQEVMSPDEP